MGGNTNDGKVLYFGNDLMHDVEPTQQFKTAKWDTISFIPELGNINMNIENVLTKSEPRLTKGNIGNDPSLQGYFYS